MLSITGRYKYIILVVILMMAGLDVYLVATNAEPESRGDHNPFMGEIMYIQPAPNVESDKLVIISHIIEANFNKSVNILPPQQMKRSFYDRGRQQYDATKIISWAKEHIPPGAFRIIVVLDDDIFSSEYNFIFGQAEMSGKECVISLARFADPSRPLEPKEEKLFTKRLASLLLHELGHTMGLSHCGDPSCVMQFANSMRELDGQPIHYCLDCLKEIRHNGYFDVLTETGDAVLYLRSTSSGGENNVNSIR
jgi:archaemetzincin